MIKDVIAAFEQHNYPEATRLLQGMPAADPWGVLYRGRLREVSADWDGAEVTYRQLLQADHGPKITTQARQGLQRLETLRNQKRQKAIAQATVDLGSPGLGILVLEPIAVAAKLEAARQLARIMKIDPYFARMLIPSRGWRVYRTASLGELKVYGEELEAAEIPAFWFPLGDIQQIQVLQASYFKASSSEQGSLIYESEATQGEFTFRWSEITQRVDGLLPIFEQVVDLDVRGKLERKQKTQDHAQFCDLHLPSRGCIVRIYNGAYQFNQGIKLASSEERSTQATHSSSWSNWQNLSQFLNRHLPKIRVWSDFTAFGETAVEQTDLLDKIKPEINLFRRVESYWDPAFHLYSGLVFLKG